MANHVSTQNTGTHAAADSPNSVAQLWSSAVQHFEENNDFYKQMEGKSERNVIQVKQDLTKGAGQKITFTTDAGLYNDPHYGDDEFADGDHFEELYHGSYDLEVDWIRHAVSGNERMEEVLGLRGEILDDVPRKLGEWLGRYKTETLQMMFNHQGGSENYVYAGNSAGIDSITAADTLNYDEILAGSSILEGLNGTPAMLGQDASGNAINKYCVVATKDSIFSLKNDASYKQVIRESDVRGVKNKFFAGGVSELDGSVIKKYNPIEHAGYGPIGSPMNPLAALGVAITAANTAQDIKGGRNATGAAKARTSYFKWFPKYAYRFPTSTLTPQVANFYVIIMNPRDGSANGGKWGFYEISANDGVTLTMTKRLRSATSGAAYDQVGNVEWDSSVNTDSHPVNSKIIYANANGVPIGKTHFLGSAAAYRGYGKYTRKRTKEKADGDFLRRVFIASVFGQTPRFDLQDRAPGFLTLTHALEYAGMPITPTLA